MQVINAVYRNHEQYAVHAIKHDVGRAIPATNEDQQQHAVSMG